jgi:hypothetical protein
LKVERGNIYSNHCASKGYHNLNITLNCHSVENRLLVNYGPNNQKHGHFAEYIRKGIINVVLQAMKSSFSSLHGIVNQALFQIHKFITCFPRPSLVLVSFGSYPVILITEYVLTFFHQSFYPRSLWDFVIIRVFYFVLIVFSVLS